jgi:hypothetical protein
MTKDINLFDLGCLVQVSVGMWSARKMLTKADLKKVGVDPRGVPDDLCNLGRKILVPKEEVAKFTSIEQQARSFLSRWAFQFGIGSAYFVPATALPDVQERLEDLKSQYAQAVDSFLGRFEQMKEVIQARHPEFWSRCLRPHYPRDAASLRERFYFKYFVFKVAGLGETQEMSVEEAMTTHAAVQERTRLLKEQMSHEVGEFVEQAVGTLRSETVRFCDLVVARVNGTALEGEEEPKKLTGRSLICFKRYVEWFQQMNLFGDDQIESMLADFRSTYLDPFSSPANLQTPVMQQQITERMAEIRKLAAAESGEMSPFIRMAKRRIQL